MIKKIKTVALIVAAGRGVRAGSAETPKQYFTLANGETVLTKTMAAFDCHPAIDHVLTVIHADDETRYQNACAGIAKALPPVFGGASRQDSVRNGLEALEELSPELVLVHDAARPFVSARLISDVIDALKNARCALPTIDVIDTLKLIEQSSSEGAVLSTPERTRFRRAQTPQGFHFIDLLKAHQNAKEEVTDDAALMDGTQISLIEGDESNIKLTTPEDFAAMKPTTRYENRSATGFDVHAFTEGDSVTLGGIKIPHTQSLAGHSDADVALYALTDALLGSLALGDIGDHFPPSDNANKNRDSAEFLEHAVQLVSQKGGRITHLDLTIICESPKIYPHREAIQTRIASLCGLTLDRVSVKATTTEKLGFTGRQEGIAAQALASIEVPVKDA